MRRDRLHGTDEGASTAEMLGGVLFVVMLLVVAVGLLMWFTQQPPGDGTVDELTRRFQELR